MPYHPDQQNPADVLPTDAGYDLWSQLYDDEFNPLIALEEPQMRGRLVEVTEKAVLDVGTGTGRQADWLASKGANVTAMDFSSGMLSQARKKPHADRIEFLQADLQQAWPIAEDRFEIALSALVLDHIQELDHFFTEMARVVAPGGRVLCSVMHPGMMLRGLQARFTDPETGQKIMPASAANETSDYLMAARRAGLELVFISEHVVDDELADAQPRAAKYRGWPLLLMMEWSIPR